MYLHMGQDFIVREQEISGILSWKCFPVCFPFSSTNGILFLLSVIACNTSPAIAYAFIDDISMNLIYIVKLVIYVLTE